MRRRAPAVRVGTRVQPGEDVDPVVRPVRAGTPAEEHELRIERVPDVRGEVDEARAGPPYAHRRAEGIPLLRQEPDADRERERDLEEASAEDHHELPERPEEDVPGLVDRQ